MTNTLSDELNLQGPVMLGGPYPLLLRTAKVGDLVQLQVSHPIVPVFPYAVRFISMTGFFKFIEAVTTIREVFCPAAGATVAAGGLGVNYASVFLKARRRGNITIELEFLMSDRSVISVPFTFQIS